MTKDEALDLALEALKLYSSEHAKRYGLEGAYDEEKTKGDLAITAIKQARSAPVQEPVDSVQAIGNLMFALTTWKATTSKTAPAAWKKLLQACTDMVATEQPAPVQEPIACGYDETTGNCTNNPCCYTTPPAAQPAPVQDVSLIDEGKTAAPVQEPVAWLDLSKMSDKGMVYATGFKVSDKQSALCLCTPPAAQRQWVGLSHEEVMDSWDEIRDGDWAPDFYAVIEAKLKERNV